MLLDGEPLSLPRPPFTHSYFAMDLFLSEFTVLISLAIVDYIHVNTHTISDFSSVVEVVRYLEVFSFHFFSFHSYSILPIRRL